MSENTQGATSPQRPWKPIVHLLVFGALVALLITVVKGPPVEREDINRVVISNADIEQVHAKWLRTWNRPPTKLELRRALAEHIRQEVLYREALFRGLDREDPVVRIAMVNKLKMIAAAQAESVEPGDEEIQAYFALRQERYRIPAQLSFTQIYYSKERRGDRTQNDAESDLQKIRQQQPSSEEISNWGDGSLLQNVLVDETEDGVSRMFGAGFGVAVLAQEPGQWEGPLESGYGLHLVRVDNRVESRVPDWTEVRDQIQNDMIYEARKAAEDRMYAEIAARYQVVYDQSIAEILEGEQD
jgi:hypothetical protein